MAKVFYSSTLCNRTRVEGQGKLCLYYGVILEIDFQFWLYEEILMRDNE